MAPFSSRGPRAALTWSSLLALSSSLALAQEPAPPPPPPAAETPEEEEIRRLREAAQEDVDAAGGQPQGGDETERLRRAADAEVAGPSPEQAQLLNAFYSVANRLNAFNPRITAIGDVLGRLSASSDEEVVDGFNLDDRITLREVELDIRADVDPYAKAVLILALEEVDSGEYEATVEEGYVTLETLPLGFNAKIGRFRVPFGRINALHTHDLPQATRPLALTDLFGEEGFAENGALVGWLAPVFPLELTAGLLNGENEQLLAGRDSDDPAWFGRAEAFVSIDAQTYISLGSSYLFGYRDAPTPVDARGAPSLETHLWGADVMVKWQRNQFQSLVVQGEVYHLRRELGAGDREHAFGGYAFVQAQPLQRWYLGVRYDWSNFALGVEDQEQWAAGAWVSYYTTEFLRFRVGYEHRERPSTDGGLPDLDTVYAQLTFVFGSHPAEPFWFNR